ncbi:MAG: hypothetical protein LC685_01280 [Actinobacteria bacterium]|nr:hypothetical protein [Actinomycetota bacterium]
MRRAACLALCTAVAFAVPAGAEGTKTTTTPPERSYVSYLKVSDVGPTIRWGFYVCLPRRMTLRWQIEVRSLTTREVDRYTHFAKDRQARNCTYYELELRDLRSRFDPQDSYRTRVTVRYADHRIMHSKAKSLRVTDPAAPQP